MISMNCSIIGVAPPDRGARAAASEASVSVGVCMFIVAR